MEPFKVTLNISTPMLASGPIMLDSILAWCAVKEANNDWEAGDSLPLKSRENAGKKYWAASRFFYHWTPAHQTHMAKRIPLQRLERFSSATKVINPGGGINKAYHEMLQPMHVHKAIAFGVGDVDEIDYLLRRITHFGKNVRSGYGRVTSAVADPFDHDWSENIDGILVRNIPENIENADGMGAYKAPYWNKEEWIPVRFSKQKMPESVKIELEK